MRTTFVKKSANSFFEGKKAIVLVELTNIGKEVIEKGSMVSIKGKNQRNRLELDVKQNDIHINGVEAEHLELLKESEINWPIERDTLDIRNHEFNLKK